MLYIIKKMYSYINKAADYLVFNVPGNWIMNVDTGWRCCVGNSCLERLTQKIIMYTLMKKIIYTSFYSNIGYQITVQRFYAVQNIFWYKIISIYIFKPFCVCEYSERNLLEYYTVKFQFWEIHFSFSEDLNKYRFARFICIWFAQNYRQEKK